MQLMFSLAGPCTNRRLKWASSIVLKCFVFSQQCQVVIPMIAIWRSTANIDRGEAWVAQAVHTGIMNRKPLLHGRELGKALSNSASIACADQSVGKAQVIVKSWTKKILRTAPGNCIQNIFSSVTATAPDVRYLYQTQQLKNGSI